MATTPVLATAACSNTSPNLSQSTQDANLQAKPQKLENFGVQLSTLTPLMLKDFAGTLAAVAAIGYKQIEFSAMGFLGRSPQRITQLLDEHNLQAPVGRVTPALPDNFFSLPQSEARRVYMQKSGPENFINNIKYALDNALALDQAFLNIPAIPKSQFASLDELNATIESINQGAEICAAQGVLLGYHNHDWELKAIDGVIPLEAMLQQTTADKVGFQIDAYWIVKGGGNLDYYLQTYPGRFPSCHLKDIDDNGDFADVGSGNIDFAAFIRGALANGCQHFFVERDGPPQPLQSVTRSYQYLAGLTF